LDKKTLKTGSQLLSDLPNKPANVSAHDVITPVYKIKRRDCVEPESGVVSARIRERGQKEYIREPK
jgi:hypothetical protein